MNAKQLFTITTLSFAATAALADDITMVKDTFMSSRSRAEVQAEVLNARAAGVQQFATETQSFVGAARPAMNQRERQAVRSELRASPRLSAGELVQPV